MTQMPVMPVLVERLLADTNHLSNEEMGAYMRLLLNGWLRDAQLRQEDMQRLAQAPPRNWQRLWKRLRPFFDEMSPKVYTQRRLHRELSRARKNHDANVLRNEKMRAGLAKKNKGAPKNDEGSTDTVTTSVTKPKMPPEGSVTEIVTVSVTAPVMDIVTALNPEKEEALPSKGRELLPSQTSKVATPNGLAEGSAGTGSPGLGGRSPPQPSETLKPTPALLATPLVKKARTGLMAALDSEEDIDE